MATKPQTPEPRTLAANIRDAREAAGITQVDLARLLGHEVTSDSSFISRIESGKQQPRIDTLQRIAKAIGTTLEALIPE